MIWADELRAAVSRRSSPPFTDATGVGVEVQIVDFGDIRTQVTTQAPAGEGPDLFVGAHDWTGELAANGVLEPIDLGAKSGRLLPGCRSALSSVDGQLYAVPTAMRPSPSTTTPTWSPSRPRPSKRSRRSARASTRSRTASGCPAAATPPTPTTTIRSSRPTAATSSPTIRPPGLTRPMWGSTPRGRIAGRRRCCRRWSTTA